jgi:uncharacterized protein (DUF433 family)
MTTVAYAHIETDSHGTPVVAGTRTKVLEIALDRVAHGWAAEEIQRQHQHLSLGQIHSALAYYFDHQEEFDRQIALQLDQVEQNRLQAGPSVAAAKLRALGRLP